MIAEFFREAGIFLKLSAEERQEFIWSRPILPQLYNILELSKKQYINISERNKKFRTLLLNARMK